MTTLVRRLFPACAAVLISCGPPPAAPPVDPLSFLKAERGATVVKELTAAGMEGRGLGSAGLDQAATYLAGRFAEAGLTPAGDGGSFFQRVPVTTGIGLQPKRNWVRFGEGMSRRSLKLDIEFTPLSVAATDERAIGPLVFVGYGITAPEVGYDDYAGLDVKGKIVVAMRYAPGARLAGQQGVVVPAGKQAIPLRYQELRFKAMTARQHGAAGLIVINGPRSVGGRADELIKLGALPSAEDSGIPVVQIIRPVLEELLGADRIRQAQEQIDTTFTPRSFYADETVPPFKLQTALERQRKDGKNVVGLVAGSDPAKAGEWVVVGAHYDHLGMGGPGSQAPGSRALHPGADDNASGIAALCEIADAVAKAKPKRPVVFVAFTGEEVGLIGARFFVSQAGGKVVAMVNLDMVGRLRGDALFLQGMDTAPGWRDLVGAANRDQLQLAGAGGGAGPSDNLAFSLGGVPALLLTTGVHGDYHRPSDTADKLNYDGITKVARFALRLALAAADRPARLAFAPPAPAAAPTGAAGQHGVYLGAVPDFSQAQGPGVLVLSVRPGSPAAQAGIQRGDVLVKLGDAPLRNLSDLSAALRQRQAGDKLAITLQRAGQEVAVEATLAARR
jgi:aminopeptidase YwaD